MSNFSKKSVFLCYYLIIVLLSVNNFNFKELQFLYDFFDDKDKFLHFVQYFIFVILALYTFKIKHDSTSFVALCLFIMISSGIAEFIQISLPSRNSSYIDSFYDVLGGACGFMFFSGVSKVCCRN